MGAVAPNDGFSRQNTQYQSLSWYCVDDTENLLTVSVRSLTQCMGWAARSMEYAVPEGQQSGGNMWEVVAGGALGSLGSIFNNERNLSYQRETQDYMKGMQERYWQREDNATQRRVADLKAAGLSPVLAAGSAASSGAPIKIDPMHADDSLGVQGAINGIQAVNQHAMMQSNLETAEAQRDLLESQRGQNDMKTAILGKEFGLYSNTGGHPKYQDVWGKRISSILEAMSKGKPIAKEIKQEAERRAAKNWDEAGKTPAERAKAQGKWHLFNQF